LLATALQRGLGTEKAINQSTKEQTNEPKDRGKRTKRQTLCNPVKIQRIWQERTKKPTDQLGEPGNELDNLETKDRTNE